MQNLPLGQRKIDVFLHRDLFRVHHYLAHQRPAADRRGGLHPRFERVLRDHDRDDHRGGRVRRRVLREPKFQTQNPIKFLAFNLPYVLIPILLLIRMRKPLPFTKTF